VKVKGRSMHVMRLVAAVSVASAVGSLSSVTLAARGQSAGAERTSTAFDVASVRENRSSAPDGPFGIQPGGRFVMVNGPIRQVVAMAYEDTPEVIGLPAWVSSRRFDIVATPAQPSSPAATRRMLRTLLADHFQFVAHIEQQRRSGYALVVDRIDRRLGARMRRSEVDCTAFAAAVAAGDNARARELVPDQGDRCTARIRRGLFESTGMTMADLSRTLRRAAGGVVIDETGLQGDYEFVLEFNPDPLRQERAAASPASRPSIFAALREQLGLRLETREITTPVLVVDRIEPPGADYDAAIKDHGDAGLCPSRLTLYLRPAFDL
jgi:uncharacterized protein (TIGR03435 family)